MFHVKHWLCLSVLCSLVWTATASAQKKAPLPEFVPPSIPGGKTVVTDTTPDFLKPSETIKPEVKIAKEAPTVDFMYYEGQTYRASLWSNWGDGLAVGNKYYSAIGDHSSPGNAFVYEYDADKKELRRVFDVRQVIQQPEGRYTPGKIHSRLDLGSDGWLYFSTHRGSTRDTKPPYFAGDWILRYNITTGQSEVVAHAPLPGQTLPTSFLDPDRLIYYAGAQDGANVNPPSFLAYDVKNRKVLYTDGYGPYRAVIFARSTGKIYFHGNASSPGRTAGEKNLVRFDPEKPVAPVEIPAAVGLRCASGETPDGKVYTIDGDQMWVFDTKTEKAEPIGPTAVGAMTYTTSVDADSTGRYLYYVPGAHGGSERDNSAVVQYDTKTNTRKVIAFLHPVLYQKYGFIPCGTFSTAVSPDGDKVYITWNGNRDTKPEGLGKRVDFNICALTVVHIPASERQP